jgi:nucleoside-diphosphate-sugar epimerase
MKTVFVTGATGTIGNAVATTFRRHGYHVKGLTRSEKGAKLLAAQEIEPVVSPISDIKHIEADIAVHAYTESGPDRIANDLRAIEMLSKCSLFLYTSGCWIHGNSKDIVNEESPLKPLSITSWRPAHEQKVVQAKGVVIRPGFVYGGEGSLTASWFASAAKGSVEIAGDGTNTWSMIHKDDLARAYLLAAEKNIRSTIFDVTDGMFPTVREMAEAIANLAKIPGKIRSIEGMEGVLADQKIRSIRTQPILGWKPYHTSFLSEVATYFSAWKATQPS